MEMSRRSFLGGSAVALVGLGLASAVRRERPRRVLLLAGPSSHSYGGHEHPAGVGLLADLLGAVDGVEAKGVVGWPEDESLLAWADALLVYGDGEAEHPLNGHFDAVAAEARRGMGLGFLHYALIVDAEQEQRRLVDWIGGRYELSWSVNPMWAARVDALPAHPITRGVEPFTLQDEWYYHMRFREGLAGVTPLLSALPPKESLDRPDGPHSGNPDVRRAVLEERRRQHLAWCCERQDGGRGFGFTGGHWHWNWAHDGFRTLVVNAAAWLAGLEIPATGVVTPRPTLDELIKRVGTPPDGWDRAAVEQRLASWGQE